MYLVELLGFDPEYFGIYDTLDAAIAACQEFSEHNFAIMECTKNSQDRVFRGSVRKGVFKTDFWHLPNCLVKTKPELLVAAVKKLSKTYTVEELAEKLGWTESRVRENLNLKPEGKDAQGQGQVEEGPATH